MRNAMRVAIVFSRAKGYRVLRFNNLDVMTNRNGVLERIAEAAQAASPSPPSPASGGGSANSEQGA